MKRLLLFIVFALFLLLSLSKQQALAQGPGSFPTTGILKIWATDTGNQRALSYANVYWNKVGGGASGGGSTNSSGYFAYSLSPGTYTYSVSKYGCSPSSVGGTVTITTNRIITQYAYVRCPTPVTPKPATPIPTRIPTKAPTVLLKVSPQSATGEKLSNKKAWVDLNNGALAYKTTDSSGVVTFSVTAGKTYTIRAGGQGYVTSQAKKITPGNNGAKTSIILYKPTPTGKPTTVQKLKKLTGRLMLDKNGNGLLDENPENGERDGGDKFNNMTVSLKGSNLSQSVKTTSSVSSNGNYTFNSLTPGIYTIILQTTPQGFTLTSSPSQQITVDNTDTANKPVHFLLKPNSVSPTKKPPSPSYTEEYIYLNLCLNSQNGDRLKGSVTTTYNNPNQPEAKTATITKNIKNGCGEIGFLLGSTLSMVGRSEGYSSQTIKAIKVTAGMPPVNFILKPNPSPGPCIANPLLCSTPTPSKKPVVTQIVAPKSPTNIPTTSQSRPTSYPNATETPVATTNPTTLPTQTPFNSDFNNDTLIDKADYLILSCEFRGNGTCIETGSQKKADANRDGNINLIDFIIWRNAIK